MRRASLLALALLAASAAHADDWLQSALDASNAAVIVDEPPAAKPNTAWIPYQASEFTSELPSSGWYAHEEQDALGTVVRVFGPDAPSGAIRTTLSVRLYDRSTPGYLPAKEAVDALRRNAPGRDATPVLAMRVSAGLARIFEVTLTRRIPFDDGPSLPELVHEDVAVIPRGESYYLVRMVSTRESYLNSRAVFIRFVKLLTPLGAN